MQLNIRELEDTLYDNSSLQEDDYNEFQLEKEYEKIPENNVPIKVIKKGVHFADSTLKPMHQTIPKSNAKITRPHVPQQKPKISYEDILSKMGMLVSDGKLHLIDRNTLTSQQQEIIYSQRQQQPQYQQPQNQSQYYAPQPTNNTNIPKNSYIYNKYFKDEIQPDNTVNTPKTLREYKLMLLDNYIEKQRIKQMKSRKLVIPTSNINFSAGHSANLNKLFNFSKR